MGPKPDCRPPQAPFHSTAAHMRMHTHAHGWPAAGVCARPTAGASEQQRTGDEDDVAALGQQQRWRPDRRVRQRLVPQLACRGRAPAVQRSQGCCCWDELAMCVTWRSPAATTTLGTIAQPTKHHAGQRKCVWRGWQAAGGAAKGQPSACTRCGMAASAAAAYTGHQPASPDPH